METRGGGSGVRALVHGEGPGPVPVQRARRLFFAGLGLVYAIAFGSLWSQVHGLFGARGIQPLPELLARAREFYGSAALWRVPSVLWLGAGDRGLDLVCGVGLAAGLALVLGWAARPAAALAFALYLSLTSVGEPFLNFQWDVLLLETGLLAIPLAPGGLRPSAFRGREVPRVLWWLVRWLLFRLMLLSGLVKLWSGDPTWRDGTALAHHYWTQPLPHALAWYAAQLPLAVQRYSLYVTFAIELVLPFLALGPRRARLVACAGFALLMAAISATGNYGFFNLLTLVLCVALLDDRILARVLPGGAKWSAPPAAATRARAGRVLVAAFAVLVLLLTTDAALRRLGLVQRPLGPLEPLADFAAPLRSFNAYGLFAVMTTERPEIIVEGSRDGERWEPYVFRWKPGPLERRPGFAGVHMPRLDWQMWFAALGSWRQNAWYLAFLQRLLEGSPAVLALLAEDPFAGEPPRFVRSTRFLYRFAEPERRSAGGAWWARDLGEAYCPTFTLRGGALSPATR